MDANAVLNIAMIAGQTILESGGETYRVEEAISIICNAYGMRDSDSYVTPTGIIISVTDAKGKTVSRIRRIRKRSTNLEKVALVNTLTRQLKNKLPTPKEFANELRIIQKCQNYSRKTVSFAAAFAASFYTLLFGGNIFDFCVAFCIGITIKFVTETLGKVKFSEFFCNLAGGAIAVLMAYPSAHVFHSLHTDKIIIGSIMLLVPGLAITNAVRDTIAGDLVAGSARAIEAMVTAIAIAAGTGIAMKFLVAVLGSSAI